MSNIVRVPPATAGTVPAGGTDYQKQNDLLYAFGLWGMGACPIDLPTSKVLKGAIFTVGGVLYRATADETITGTPSNYVKITPISAGAECSASYVASLTGVSWSDVYNGYVDGSGNLYLFDEAQAFLANVITGVKTISGKLRSGAGSKRFLSSGTMIVPAGVTTIFFTGTAAGGNGGAGGNTYGSNSGGGGGGGGGGVGANRQCIPLTVVPFEIIAVTIGAVGSNTVVSGSVSGTLLTLAPGANGSVGGNGVAGGGAGGAPGGAGALGDRKGNIAGTAGAGGAGGAGGGSVANGSAGSQNGYQDGGAGAGGNLTGSSGGGGGGGKGGGGPFGNGGNGGRGANGDDGAKAAGSSGGYGCGGGGGGGGGNIGAGMSGGSGGAAFAVLEW